MLLKILPAQALGPAASKAVLIFFDEGSSVSLISDELAKTLGLKRQNSKITLTGLNDTVLSVKFKHRTEFSLKSSSGGEQYLVKGAYIIKGLKLPPQSLKSAEIACLGLSNTELRPYEFAYPQILLGQDNWPLIVTRGLREAPNKPFTASLTLLGWVAHGCASNCSLRTTHLINSGNKLASHTSPDDDLHDLVKSYFSLEALGVSSLPRTSKAEERARSLLEKTTVFRDGHWETGLLWNSEKPELPNNYSGALSRLKALERRLDKEPKFSDLYYSEMERLFQEGYATATSREVKEGHVEWYVK